MADDPNLPRWATGEEAMALSREWERRKAAHLKAGGRLIEGQTLPAADGAAAQSDADDKSVSHPEPNISSGL